MKPIFFFLLLTLAALFVFTDMQAQTITDTSQSALTIHSNWLDTFDLDGDRINDHISFDFSGGAHCCYKINIRLSSDKKERKFPFETDGGYEGGVDNSQPDQFDIRDTDGDGLPEIVMRIQTYNGNAEKIPKKWKRDYGIKSHYIVIEYAEGEIRIRDYTSKDE